MGQPRHLLVVFYRKIVDFSGIRTRIVRVEGKHADYMTTTTAHHLHMMMLQLPKFERVISNTNIWLWTSNWKCRLVIATQNMKE